MKISNAGLGLIKKFEGLRLKAYMPTPNDRPTIGYGHTKTTHMDMKITRATATELLKDDISWVEIAVKANVKVPLTQPQYDALCSFVYNLGATNFKRSTLLKKLNKGDYNGAGIELLRWDKQGSKILLGLTRRREAELALFSSEPNEPIQAKPTRAAGGLFGALIAFLKALTPKKDK